MAVDRSVTDHKNYAQSAIVEAIADKLSKITSWCCRSRRDNSLGSIRVFYSITKLIYPNLENAVIQLVITGSIISTSRSCRLVDHADHSVVLAIHEHLSVLSYQGILCKMITDCSKLHFSKTCQRVL